MSGGESARLAVLEERVTRALEQLAEHEERCDIRYANIEKALVSLFTRWWTAAAAVITALFAACGYLLINGTPWQ